MIHQVLQRYSRHAEFLGEELTDVGQVGAMGSQVIHLASFADHWEDVEELIQAGADVNATGDLGLRPLHYAVLGGSLGALKLLLTQGADASKENEYGETPAQMAHILGHGEIEAELLSSSGPSGCGFDDQSFAQRRWKEFGAIQQANFWPE